MKILATMKNNFYYNINEFINFLYQHINSLLIMIDKILVDIF
jgi:hypothetical protein